MSLQSGMPFVNSVGFKFDLFTPKFDKPQRFIFTFAEDTDYWVSQSAYLFKCDETSNFCTASGTCAETEAGN